MIRSTLRAKLLRRVVYLLPGLWCVQGLSKAEAPASYATGAHPFPSILRPYRPWRIPAADLANSDTLQSAIQEGAVRLSMDVLMRAVVENNLGVVLARFYPSIAQTDLLRSHSGASPRGVDAAEIPSSIFAGAEGGSILGTAAGGGGGGVNNAGGITGAAGAVNIRPAGVFDPTLSVAFSVDHTSSPLNTLVVAGVPSVTTGTGAASLNYVQAFSSGTSFQVSYAFQRQGSTQRHLLFDPAFTPGFTATISQQMLNGFGFRVNRTLIRVAENEQKIERESFRKALITALADAKNAYWDLVAAKESVGAAEEALAAAQQLAENNRRQVESGVITRLDLATAEAQVAASQRDLIVARTNLQIAGLQLKTTFTKNLAEPWASAVIEPADTFPNPDDSELPRLEEAVKIANENRPEVSIAQGNINSQLDVLPFLRNALLPNVNAFALVSNVGLFNVFGTAFTEAVQFRYPQFAFGVTVTFPIRSRQAQADDIRARIELDQSKDNLVRTQSQVEVDVQNALIAARQSRAQVAAARETVRLQRQRLEAEQLRFQEGLSTPYNVVLVQRDLLTAQLAEVQALDAYAKAGVTLDLAMGTTLESNHVDLDDALRDGVRRSSNRN